MNIVKKLFLMTMILAVLFISSCGDDDEGLDQTSLDLIGVWQSDDEVSLSVGITGLTQEEIDVYEDFIGLFLNAFAQGFFGTIEFKDDLSYTSSFGGEAQTGTWEVLSDGETLIIRENGETEETEVEIISLTSTTVVFGFQEIETDDLNEDGIDDEIIIDVELTMNKVN
jgi:hypothetical protein